ncbi:4113_t:CDS:2 [Racocetra persica]|uniref:4113_t:CDS:1 n=1 Tax=Racocetra persica TaxID=160502 RepID=A0ACA9KL82_9GLOM|nr:4113_t:CDS:2 [Racocetra persica]
MKKNALAATLEEKTARSPLGRFLPTRASLATEKAKDALNKLARGDIDAFLGVASSVATVTLGVAEALIPGVGTVKKGLQAAKFALGTTKDVISGGVGGFGLGSIGNLKDGLAQAQGEIESKSQELTENIDQLRAELERQKEDLANQLKSQESRLETRLVDEIRQQEAKITQLQAETKKQLVEEQKKLLEEAIRKLEAAQQNINRASQEQIKNAEAKFSEFSQKFDQAGQERQELRDELQKQAEILRWHEQRLNSFAQEMENIKQEVNQRMDKLEGRINQALQLAQRTSQRVDALATEMAKTQDKVDKLDKQMQQNQQAIQQAREEVQRTNQRLDDFIKRQELLDFSAQQLVFDQIQKTLANKAEEAKLLATLNLLEETKNLLPEEIIPTTGAETADQPVISLLQSLISALEGQESVRRPSEYKPREDRDLSEYRRSEIDAEQPEEAKDREKVNTNLEKLEEMKKEVLERLQPVQQAIKQDLEALENRKETKPTRNQEQISRQYRINKTQKEITELEEKDNNQSKSNAEKERIARELQQKREELETLQKQQEFVEQLDEQEKKVLQGKKQELEQQ